MAGQQDRQALQPLLHQPDKRLVVFILVKDLLPGISPVDDVSNESALRGSGCSGIGQNLHNSQ
jgi:hypothetical protein